MKSVRLFTLSLFVLLTSCASIFQNGPDGITISSDPSGASVTLDGQPVGKTPCHLTVSRTADGQITIQKAGYDPVAFRLKTSLNGTTLLNVFWGWLMPVGFLVDGLAGNMSAWQSPNQIALAPTSDS